ncbi:MAG: 6-pyruvoyl tetrahydropterin synthase family protein [Gemmatimonadales bacterium]
MATVTVTRRVHFNAAHRLHSNALSDEENARTFGPCNNPNYHGHNYELEVSVTGQPDETTGYVADLSEIKRIVEREVLTRFDHRNLNLDLPEFVDLNPTVENIVTVIWQLLEHKLPAQLTRLVLWETPRNYAVYEGS